MAPHPPLGRESHHRLRSVEPLRDDEQTMMGGQVVRTGRTVAKDGVCISKRVGFKMQVNLEIASINPIRAT